MEDSSFQQPEERKSILERTQKRRRESEDAKPGAVEGRRSAFMKLLLCSLTSFFASGEALYRKEEVTGVVRFEKRELADLLYMYK